MKDETPEEVWSQGLQQWYEANNPVALALYLASRHIVLQPCKCGDPGDCNDCSR